MTASLQGRVATAVQLAYSVAVVLTFPLQAFPALQVTCGALGCPTAGTQRSVVASSLEVLLGVIAYVARNALWHSAGPGLSANHEQSIGQGQSYLPSMDELRSGGTWFRGHGGSVDGNNCFVGQGDRLVQRMI